MSFWGLFETQFAPKLAHRAAGFRRILAALGDCDQPAIVETGCLREAGNFAGDGQSTLIFGHFASAAAGRLVSIDCSPSAVMVAQAVCGEAGLWVEVRIADSVRFLSALHDSIDLLYLDSLDFDGNHPQLSAMQHLFELTAASHALRPGAIVAVDDMGRNDGRPFGKGMLVADYMERIGAALILDDYQMAWRLPG